MIAMTSAHPGCVVPPRVMRALPVLLVVAGCSSAPSLARLNDGQAAALVYTLDANQMALAESVRERLERPEVIDVADMLDRDHATVDDQANSVICREHLWARPSDLSRAFEEEALSLYYRLGVVATPDDTYLAAEREAQRDALTVFDCLIAPSIEDVALHDFVAGPLREHLASHVHAVADVMSAPVETPSCSALCDDGTLGYRVHQAACDAS